MAQMLIRKIPENVAELIKQAARNKGISAEQEVRELLEKNYRSKESILDDVRARWKQLPPTSATDINAWIEEGRE